MENNNKSQNLYTIYKITCLVNGKVYVGVTSLTAKKRFGEHWRHRSRPKMEHLPMCQDMSAFGKKAFTVETLEDSIAPSEARDRENYWLEYHEANGYDLYNQRIGGGGRIKLTDEQKQLIIELYAAGKSIAKIGEEMGISEFPVSQVVQQCGISQHYKRMSKEMYCVETGIIYPSVREAARQLGMDRSDISKCCRGKRKTVGGYHFEFV